MREIGGHRRWVRRTVWLLLLTCAAAAPGGYRQAVPGYRYQFPRDDFEHPDFKTEWWYYTGNVESASGRHYGFELVFFRLGQHAGERPPASSWRIDDLYLAHLALTDIDGHRFRYFQRLNRAGPGIAGASLEKSRIWNGNWQAQWDPAAESQTISAVEDGVRFTLHLSPSKPLVIHGVNGVSEKSEAPGHASYYVSFPRLAVDGSLNGEKVTGSAWMDHEWFSNLIAETDQGWDWFSVQLDNHTELMLFQLRKRDKAGVPFLSGTFIRADGHATHLKPSDFTLQPMEYWTSPKTGARYPIRWRIAVPSMKVAIDCAAAMPNQELVSEQRNGPTYWEGAVRYSGSATGVGYLEMTGYAGRVRIE